MIHRSKGDMAEAFAMNLLLERGYSVRNLNDTRNNNPSVDLEAEGIGSPFLVSVKSCWTPNRQLRLERVAVCLIQDSQVERFVIL